MPPITLRSTANAQSPLLKLPQELVDLIFSFLYSETNLDIGPTRDAELRIFSNHLILRRTWPVPPPSWKGCSKVFRTCRAFYANGLNILYPQMTFSIRINGDDEDPGQRRSRLHSDYPFGRLDDCMPLRYLGAAQISLSAGSVQDLERLEERLGAFEEAVRGSERLRVGAVRVSLGRLVVTRAVFERVKRITDVVLKWCGNAKGDMKREGLMVKIFTNPGNDVPDHFLKDLASLVRSVDSDASVVSYSKGMVLL
ncbi:hypothetical protein DOTSEDRAFT_52420 [Dothistroma septosporum NZE10]|uniref:F-box domain-containing protein n=1 Tax=Dothistroma septosporum (strain NZE10 / CBS 128990) TaxID=675120 RepID=N1PNP5_DOTSN|nr:hypothetical protein DOTSEDRAFT_52420 [Dothistroma septosporum NZE10]